MKQNRRPQRSGRLSDEQRRLLPVVIIPLIVIILMIVIVVADRAKDKKEAEATTPTETVISTSEPETMETAEGETGEPVTTEPETTVSEETEPADEFATDTLKRDSVPELLELMRTYFKARSDADAETMNRIYGIGEISETELEAQKTRMRSNSKYVQGFENVVTYVMDGTTSDAWLVYAIADIRFHSVKTPAPMIMWCYVKKGAEGNYQIMDNASLSENVQQFIDRANHSEAVRRLASSVNVKLKDALSADTDLNSVYGVLRDGSPVWQSGEEGPAVVIGQ